MIDRLEELQNHVRARPPFLPTSKQASIKPSIMASLVVHRSHQLLSPVAGVLLVVTVVISFTAVADSARSSAPAPAPTTAAKPIEIYPDAAR